MLDNKGQIRIIEAFLAVSVMFSVMIFTTPMSSTPSFEKQANLRKIGSQILSNLDNNGTLGRLIEGGNWTALRQTMDLSLPQGLFYNLTIYDENMHIVNTQQISNTGQLGQQAVMSQYLCATQSSETHFYTVRLLLGWPE